MYKRTAKQQRTSAIISWALTVFLIAYLLYLSLANIYEIGVLQIILVLACMVASTMSSLKANKLAQAEKETEDAKKKENE